MAVIQGGLSGSLADVDSNLNLQVAEGLAVHPAGAAGGYYTVSGQTSSVVAVSLAANTMLMSARLKAASVRKAYVSRFRLQIAVATVGTSALIPGSIGLQRFTAQTPTGGTARTPNELNEPLAGTTDIDDIRDSNAALTGSAPTFGAVIAMVPVPIFIANGAMIVEYEIAPKYPIVLQPGDGLALRTQIAMPATQTWVYSYTMEWNEK